MINEGMDRSGDSLWCTGEHTVSASIANAAMSMWACVYVWAVNQSETSNVRMFGVDRWHREDEDVGWRDSRLPLTACNLCYNTLVTQFGEKFAPFPARCIYSASFRVYVCGCAVQHSIPLYIPTLVTVELLFILWNQCFKTFNTFHHEVMKENSCERCKTRYKVQSLKTTHGKNFSSIPSCFFFLLCPIILPFLCFFEQLERSCLKPTEAHKMWRNQRRGKPPQSSWAWKFCRFCLFSFRVQ